MCCIVPPALPCACLLFCFAQQEGHRRAFEAAMWCGFACSRSESSITAPHCWPALFRDLRNISLLHYMKHSPSQTSIEAMQRSRPHFNSASKSFPIERAPASFIYLHERRQRADAGLATRVLPPPSPLIVRHTGMTCMTGRQGSSEKKNLSAFHSTKCRGRMAESTCTAEGDAADESAQINNKTRPYHSAIVALLSLSQVFFPLCQKLMVCRPGILELHATWAVVVDAPATGVFKRPPARVGLGRPTGLARGGGEGEIARVGRALRGLGNGHPGRPLAGRWGRGTTSKPLASS